MGARGTYIVIEGPDGTGKTTQAKLLANKLAAAGTKSRYVHEPGETGMGLELEKIIKNRELARSPLTDLLLFTANRLEVYEQVIGPALEHGETIVADRNWLSSVAYQGVAGGIGAARVFEESQKWLPNEYIAPTLTILLYAPADQHERMLKGRGTSDGDYFESKPDQFKQDLQKGYRVAEELLANHNQPFVKISAAGSVEEVAERIQTTIDRLIG